MANRSSETFVYVLRFDDFILNFSLGMHVVHILLHLHHKIRVSHKLVLNTLHVYIIDFDLRSAVRFKSKKNK